MEKILHNIIVENYQEMKPYIEDIIQTFKKETIATIMMFSNKEEPAPYYMDLLYSVIDYIILINKALETAKTGKIMERISIDIIQERMKYLLENDNRKIIEDILSVLRNDSSILAILQYCEASGMLKSIMQTKIGDKINQAQEALQSITENIRKSRALN